MTCQEVRKDGGKLFRVELVALLCFALGREWCGSLPIKPTFCPLSIVRLAAIQDTLYLHHSSLYLFFLSSLHSWATSGGRLLGFGSLQKQGRCTEGHITPTSARFTF